MTIVLYSTLYGEREPLNPDCFGGFRADRTVVVSDRPREVPPGVELIVEPEPVSDPARASRRAKLMPHRFFPDADWTICLDNKSKLLRDPREIIAVLSARTDADFFAYPHFRRTCVYQEIRAVLENGLDDPGVVRERWRTYRREGMPRNAGLIEGHFIVRRKSDEVASFGEAWFDQVMRYSRRDQLSFPYLVWKTGFRYGLIAAPPRAETVKLTVFDRANRVPDFPRQAVLYQWLRGHWHALRRRIARR
ncbi:MAG: hypothetical protein RLZZ528_1592 [Pseudomonadota bacterium]